MLNNLMFFVPLRVGTQEAGKVLVFAMLGLNPAQGLAAGLISRIRELAWAFIRARHPGSIPAFMLTSPAVTSEASPALAQFCRRTAARIGERREPDPISGPASSPFLSPFVYPFLVGQVLISPFSSTLPSRSSFFAAALRL